MENKPTINPSLQEKTNLIVPIFATLLVSAAVFGSGGYFLGKSFSSKSQEPVAVNHPQNAPAPTVTMPLPNGSTTENWQPYTDPHFSFSLKYPHTYKLDYLQGQPYLNRTITWYADGFLVKDQRGDGPLVKSEKTVNTPIENTSRFTLEFGAVGGDFPHEEVWYQFANPHSTSDKDTYITIKLSAIPVLMTPEEISSYSQKTDIQKLDVNATEEFDQMVSTLKFE